MEKIKCITFDKEAQDNLPEHIKAKMKANQDKARYERDYNLLLKFSRYVNQNELSESDDKITDYSIKAFLKK